MIEIIVPCFNEEDNILILQKEVSTVLNDLEEDFRIIFIDDGSSDSSWDKISKLSSANNNITGIKLSRNFGHQAAIDAGLQNSNGDAVIIMDGDLQDDPSYLKDLIKEWYDGFDIVLAKRIKRKENFLRKFYIGVFFKLQSYLSEINIPANVGHFSLMDRKVVNEINNFGEKIKYFNGIRAYVGFNIGSIEVVKSKRRNGEPKMTYRKLLFLGIQGIFGFSSKPLTFIAILGFIISFGSLVISAYAFYFKVRYGTTILGWDFGLSSIYFLSGIQLFALSIIGKYVGNIFLEVKRRPSYIIQEKDLKKLINFSKTDSISLFLLTFCSNVFLLINSKYLNLTNLENDLDLLFRVKIDYIYLILISSIFISTTYIFADWLFKRISDKNILLLYEAIYRTFIYIGSFAIYLTILE